MSLEKKGDVMALIVIIGLIIIFYIWQNDYIVQTDIDIKNSKIPGSFNEFKLVHISDLHNKKFGNKQQYILKKIKKAKPNIIVITGDLIDRRKLNLDVTIEFVEGAVKIAPVYYVSGNHEAWSGRYDYIREILLDLGVNVLDDKSCDIEIDMEIIKLNGLSDPGFFTKRSLKQEDLSRINNTLGQMVDRGYFNVLLAHRPHLIDLYAQCDVDLVLSGHAHGGQFRIPFVGGLISPEQGLFPKYTKGKYVKGDTTMVVSRGLGNSVVPIRLFNRPEILVITLKSK